MTGQDPKVTAEERLRAKRAELKDAQREVARERAARERREKVEKLREFYADPRVTLDENRHDADCTSGVFCETFLIGVMLRGDPTREQMEAAAVLMADRLFEEDGLPPLPGRIEDASPELLTKLGRELAAVLRAHAPLGRERSEGEKNSFVEKMVAARPPSVPEDAARILARALVDG